MRDAMGGVESKRVGRERARAHTKFRTNKMTIWFALAGIAIVRKGR